MKIQNKNQGIGIIAIIAIIAVVTIGGVAAVKISQNAEMKTEMNENKMIDENKEDVIEAKIDAKAALENLKTELDVASNVTAALTAVAEVRTDLASAYADVNAEAKAELAAIMTKLDKLEADIKAQAGTAQSSLDAVVETIDISLSLEDTNNTSVDSGSNVDENTDTNDSVDVDSNSDTSVQASTTVDVDESPGETSDIMIEMGADNSIVVE